MNAASNPILKSLFSIPAGERPWHSIILWWELRRIPYNLLVGVTGFLSLMLLFAADSFPPRLSAQEADIEPLSFIVFGVLANICFTGGWTAELLARKIWKEKAEYFGPMALSLGLIFSLSMALLPGAISFLSWIVRWIAQSR